MDEAVKKMPAPARRAVARADSTLSKTVAAVKQKAADTAKQAELLVTTAQSTVVKQATSVMDQAKDLAKSVSDVVEGVVENVIPGDAKK